MCCISFSNAAFMAGLPSLGFTSMGFPLLGFDVINVRLSDVSAVLRGAASIFRDTT
jgi:hypothetical protein